MGVERGKREEGEVGGLIEDREMIQGLASKFLVIMVRVTSKTASKMRGTSATMRPCSLLMMVAKRLSTSESLRTTCPARSAQPPLFTTSSICTTHRPLTASAGGEGGRAPDTYRVW